MSSARRLRVQAENLTERLFSAQGYRRTDLQRRAQLRAMRRWNAELAEGKYVTAHPYPESAFAAVRAEMGANR